MNDMSPGVSRRDRVLHEWRAGWPVVLAGMCGTALCGFAVMPLSAFMAPLEQAFHWSRAEFSLGLSICAAMAVILPPAVGMLVDRYGVRALAVTGSLAAGMTWSLMATVTGSMVNWILLWVLYGSSIAMITYALWAAAIAAAFDAGRGLAMSIAFSGGAIAAAIGPAAANWLIEQYGFRLAFAAMGVAPGVAVAIVCWFALPKGRPSPAASGKPCAGAEEGPSGLGFREGITSLAFAKIMLMAIIINTTLLALPLHLISILGGAGIGRDDAVKITALFGIAAIVGKVSAGSVLDSVPGRAVMAAFTGLLAISIAIFILPSPGPAWSIVAVALAGLCYGGVAPTFPVLLSRYFGLRSFARLCGVMFSVLSLGAIIGPLLAAVIYDRAGSYSPFLIGSLPALSLAVLLSISLGRYPRFEPAPDDAP